MPFTVTAQMDRRQAALTSCHEVEAGSACARARSFCVGQDGETWSGLFAYPMRQLDLRTSLQWEVLQGNALVLSPGSAGIAFGHVGAHLGKGCTTDALFAGDADRVRIRRQGHGA